MQLSGKARFIIGASIAIVGAPIAIALGEAATERRQGWNANNTPVNPEASKRSCHSGYACEQPKPSAAELAASRERNNRSNERRGSVRRQCHTAFKASMFDPRSFRIEREWFNELPNDDGTGHIAYIADVSGTNGLGGRVRQNIACIADGSVITDYQF